MTSTASTAVPLDTQVGGHDGVLASADGAVIIKPCLPCEVNFYTALWSDPSLAQLRPHVPRFYGTLTLQGRLDAHGNVAATNPEVEGDAAKDERRLSYCNLTRTFVHPNVLDIKLGSVLADDRASPAKRARMEQRARETTSLETGVRLTGFNVYDNTQAAFVRTPKAFGRALTPAELPAGIAQFFPIAEASDDEDQPQGVGLPRRLLALVLLGLIDDVVTIRDAVLATQRVHMVGCSLLVAYEADWFVLQQTLREEALGDLPRGGAYDDDDDDREEGEEEDSTSSSDVLGPPCLVKLIDFAHTTLWGDDASAPDTGVLMGLETTLSLFRNRLAEVT